LLFALLCYNCYMPSIELPPAFDWSELTAISSQNGRYAFPDGVNARVAKATDVLGRIVGPEINELNDFMTDALSQTRNRFRQPAVHLADKRETHFTVVHPAGARAESEVITEFAMQKAEELSKWLLALAQTPLEPHLIVQNHGNRMSLFSARWDSVISDGIKLYPIVNNKLGRKGRLPKGAVYIKKPLAQRTGDIKVDWALPDQPPVTEQVGYGNLRTGHGNYRGGIRPRY